MAELFEAVASWQTLLLVLLVFGFAPGFVLRLLVLAYPRSDPRRRELISELYAVPRIQRPLWVTEQLEVALFEGLAHRVSATIRSIARQRRARTQTDKRGVRLKAGVGVVARVWVVAGVVAGAGVGIGIVGWVWAVVGDMSEAMTRGTAVGLGAMVVVQVVLLAGVLRIARRRLSARARRHSRPC